MSERIPVEIVAVEHDASNFLIVGDRKYTGVNITVSKETFEAMLAGYVCALCYERQAEAFPEECQAPWCQMPIRAKQKQMLEELYKGEQWIGPRTSNADELERMDEESLRRHAEPSRILLPPGTRGT